MGDYLKLETGEKNPQVLRNTWASHRHLPGLSTLWRYLCYNV